MGTFMIAAQTEISNEQKIVNTGKYSAIQGILSIQDGVYSLQSDTTCIGLILAPVEYMEKHGLDLKDKDTLFVAGYYSDCQMLVSTIKKGTSTIMIRSEQGTPYVITNDQKTYAANTAMCIGTTLCSLNCPTKAITMVKGKAITDASKCISCGICETGNGKNFKGCPVKAIHQIK